jgi:hypothetical protein
LGSSDPGPARDTAPAGHAEAFPIKAVRSGVAREVHLLVDRGTTARLVSAALYTDANGHPGKLLTWGSLRNPPAARWDAIPLRPTRVHQAGGYWLAVLGTGGTLAYRDRPSTVCRSLEAGLTHLRRLPAHWSTGRSRSTCSLAAFVSGIPATPHPNPKPPKAPTRTRDCFSTPGACGYPDPAYGNVGPSAPCSSLIPSGSITASSPGQTIKGRNVTGTITVDASNVTIDNVCVTADGNAQLGSAAITIASGRDALIERSTIAGANASNQSVEIAVANPSGAAATLSHDYLYNCGECVHDNSWTVTDSYIIANGMQGTDDHYEDVYCSDGTVSLNHDTLLNPESQVATVFCDTGGGGGGPCDNHVSVTNSLLGGGGYTLYTCGNASSVGSSTMNISGNRFTRCTTGPITFNSSSGGYACGGATDVTIGSGGDSHGFWPRGGYFGVSSMTYCPPADAQTWSSNVWDDSLANVGC